jgi:hypothetical protein
MKIKSPFKDYYDYVAWQYGGGDPDLVYVRDRLKDLKQVSGGHGQYESFIDLKDPGLIDSLGFLKHSFLGKGGLAIESDFDFKWLSICGHAYLLVQKKYENDWKVLNQKEHSDVWDYLTTNVRSSFSWMRNDKAKSFPESHIGNRSILLDDISKTLKAPVFYFKLFSYSSGCITIDSRIPILEQLGIDKIIPPEQLYQDISYFMANVLRDSPDLIVNDNMTDKEKIVQHGFDLKQSFRHRK